MKLQFTNVQFSILEAKNTQDLKVTSVNVVREERDPEIDKPSKILDLILSFSMISYFVSSRLFSNTGLIKRVSVFILPPSLCAFEPVVASSNTEYSS